MLPPVLPQNWRVPAGLQPSPVPDLNHQVCRSNFRQVAIRQGLHLIPLVMKNRDRDGRPGALTGACPPDLVRSRDAFFCDGLPPVTSSGRAADRFSTGKHRQRLRDQASHQLPSQRLERHLRNADLRGADLSYADLRKADLRGANLKGAKLHHKQVLDCVGVTGPGQRGREPAGGRPG